MPSQKFGKKIYNLKLIRTKPDYIECKFSNSRDKDELVKTATFKELAPYDPDWYYIRAGMHAYLSLPLEKSVHACWHTNIFIV